MGYVNGRECGIFIDQAGTYTEVEIAKDVSFGRSWDDAEISDHASKDKRSKKGLRKLSLEVTINRKPGDPMYELLRDAEDDDTILKIATASGPIAESGTELFEAEWLVMEFSTDVPEADTSTCSVTFALAADAESLPTISDVV